MRRMWQRKKTTIKEWEGENASSFLACGPFMFTWPRLWPLHVHLAPFVAPASVSSSGCAFFQRLFVKEEEKQVSCRKRDYQLKKKMEKEEERGNKEGRRGIRRRRRRR
ncbi:hypothetical protein PoB_001924800 [Plakobranchus ocellatus]|uniref:Uncharacterized protein n=1 Tax=Plakobranchus ocellatus TaxID=259542 RepID=A0AAV3ZDS4_9GAST|nr:hypothetical protein PoB_001924800 [Plakobranchus ocellatus]